MLLLREEGGVGVNEMGKLCLAQKEYRHRIHRTFKFSFTLPSGTEEWWEAVVLEGQEQPTPYRCKVLSELNKGRETMWRIQLGSTYGFLHNLIYT